MTHLENLMVMADDIQMSHNEFRLNARRSLRLMMEALYDGDSDQNPSDPRYYGGLMNLRANVDSENIDDEEFRALAITLLPCMCPEPGEEIA